MLTTNCISPAAPVQDNAFGSLFDSCLINASTSLSNVTAFAFVVGLTIKSGVLSINVDL